jgi:hypothetical protein
MTSILPLLLLVVFVSCLAMAIREGLWSNAIMFFNVLMAAMLATNYFEPVANMFDNWLDSKEHSYRYFMDFTALWVVFAASLSLLRLATDKLSRTQVRFKLPVEWAGGIFFACWFGWMMVCFTTFTLHTAPLAQNFLYGAFQETPESTMFFGLAPDRKWLAYMHTMSIDGSLARGRPEGADPTTNVFDPHAEFILKYGDRRARFEQHIENLVHAE